MGSLQRKLLVVLVTTCFVVVVGSGQTEDFSGLDHRQKMEELQEGPQISYISGEKIDKGSCDDSYRDSSCSTSKWNIRPRAPSSELKVR